MKPVFLTVLAAAALLAASGCDRNAGKFATAERMDRGLTLVLPGIEGKGHLNRGIRDGIAEGGVSTAIRIYDWTLGPAGFLINQMSESRARKKAEDLAGYIQAYRTLYPDRPVYLIGHSGGCAVAVFAAEALPPTEKVNGVLLLGASVSPEYDLSNALGQINGYLVNYWSPRDSGFLGAATTVLGTLDSKHTSAAGRVGFRLPAGASPDTLHAYRRLRQVQWDPSMAYSGNAGGHTDWASKQWVADYLAPRLRRDLRALAERPTEPAALAGTEEPNQAAEPDPQDEPAPLDPAKQVGRSGDGSANAPTMSDTPPTTQPDPTSRLLNPYHAQRD